jgi:ArsR family transcriptional regulator
MTLDLAAEAAHAPAVRGLADPLRARIVELLASEQLCVCHLTEELDVAQPLVSHHLKVLREAGLVESERWRYWTYYRLRVHALLELASRLEDLAASAPTDARRRRPCC